MKTVFQAHNAVCKQLNVSFIKFELFIVLRPKSGISIKILIVSYFQNKFDLLNSSLILQMVNLLLKIRCLWLFAVPNIDLIYKEQAIIRLHSFIIFCYRISSILILKIPGSGQLSLIQIPKCCHSSLSIKTSLVLLKIIFPQHFSISIKVVTL